MAKEYVKKMLAEYSDKQNEAERIREAGRPARMRILASKECLDLNNWAEITGTDSANGFDRFTISEKGVRFNGWDEDFINSYPLHDRVDMRRQNDEPGLSFPCTPQELIDFVDSGMAHNYGCFDVPDEFRKAVEAAACKAKEQAAPVINHSGNKRLTVMIDGREALPVRAIPYVTGWKLFTPDVLVQSLARIEEHDFATRLNLTAYHLDGNTPVPVTLPEWHEPLARFKGLNAKLNRQHDNQNEDSKAEGYDAWKRESVATIFPADLFVWLDEFEKEYQTYCSLFGRCNQPVDAKLKLAPMLHADTRAMVMEGFLPPVISVNEYIEHAATREQNTEDKKLSPDGEPRTMKEPTAKIKTPTAKERGQIIISAFLAVVIQRAAEKETPFDKTNAPNKAGFFSAMQKWIKAAGQYKSYRSIGTFDEHRGDLVHFERGRPSNKKQDFYMNLFPELKNKLG